MKHYPYPLDIPPPNTKIVVKKFSDEQDMQVWLDTVKVWDANSLRVVSHDGKLVVTARIVDE